jgi:hypothetical protein
VGWSKYDFYIIHMICEAQPVMLDRFFGIAGPMQAPPEIRPAMQNTAALCHV